MWLMTAAIAEEFYRRCLERKAESLEDRLKIMEEMVKERKAFPQTKDQVEKRIAGKKIFRVMRRDHGK